jgi:hypothetical protein
MDKKCTPKVAAGAIANLAGGSLLVGKAGTLHGVNFLPGATTNSIKVYDCLTDDTAVAANLIYESSATVTTSGVITNIYAMLPNIEFKKGLYVVQTGASSSSQLYV